VKKTISDMINSKWSIPDIIDSEITRLHEKIVPVIHGKDGLIYYIEPVDPINTSFTWGSKITEQAKNIVPFTTIYTLHSSHPVLFKPSMKEVFAFLQSHKDIDKVVAIETTFAEHHPSGYGNIGRTILYRKLV